MNKNLPIITIGREKCSGGLAVANVLSQKLDIPLYDKELLAIAAEQSGLSRDIFEEIDEKESFGFFQNALNSVLGSHNSYICNENIFQLQSQTILDISHKGSCIFVGRCADYVLRNNENVLKVFLCAPLADRQKQIAAKQNITIDEAAKLIEQTDKKRSVYYNFYTNKTWGQASSYDLCINTSQIGIEKTADFIANFFRNRFGI